MSMNDRQRELLRDAETLLRQGEERLARVRRLVEAMRDEETVGDEPPPGYTREAWEYELRTRSTLCRCASCPVHTRARPYGDPGWEESALTAALRWLA